MNDIIPSWLVDELKHAIGQMPFVGLLGFLLWRAEKRISILTDLLLELSRSSVKTDEQTIAAINANTQATKDGTTETRALKGSIDTLLAERGRRGR